MAKPRVAFVVGTRPDAIKSAPVILEFKKYEDSVDVILASTGQHREMLSQALNAFGLAPDVDLEIMTHGQSLAQITTRALEGIDRFLEERLPQLVFAQGDTSTTFVTSLASFYRQIPFAHIEAGLRTPSIDEPFPEEFNRRATGIVSALHFAPTQWAADNLRRERIDESTIFITGNTGIDAVRYVAETRPQKWYLEDPLRIVVLTTHRRENWGERQHQIAAAAARLVETFSDIRLVVPMHKNPTVRGVLISQLGNRERIDLIEPPEYADFVKLMQRSTLILTDSGGVQEEAPSFGVPVLVLRDATERPEGVDAGAAQLVGAESNRIFSVASQLLSDESAYTRMAQSRSPYGDGKASQRIRYHALRTLGIDSPEEPDWT